MKLRNMLALLVVVFMVSCGSDDKKTPATKPPVKKAAVKKPAAKKPAAKKPAAKKTTNKADDSAK